MNTIYWEENKIVDLGEFTAIFNMFPTQRGTVLKTYIYKGVHSDDEVLVSSLLSPSDDDTYLYDMAFKTLNNRKHLERVWNMHINRKKQDE